MKYQSKALYTIHYHIITAAEPLWKNTAPDSVSRYCNIDALVEPELAFDREESKTLKGPGRDIIFLL